MSAYISKVSKEMSVFSFTKKLFIITFLLQTACATKSIQTTIIRDMAIGAVVGSIYGNSFSSNKAAYTQMYAGIGAAGAALISIGVNDPDKENRELQAKLKFLNDIEIQKAKNISSDMPDDLRKLIDTHNYEVYRINRWTMRGSNLLVKESEAIELKEVKSNEE